MAILQVGKDGKAPANAKKGDTVVTAGGNYTVTGTKPGGGFTSVPASTTTNAGVKAVGAANSLAPKITPSYTAPKTTNPSPGNNYQTQPVVQPKTAPAPTTTIPTDKKDITQQNLLNKLMGMIPTRSWFENAGQTVNYDPTSKKISTSGGFSFGPEAYKEMNGISYLDPSALAGAYLNQPAKQLTPETYGNYSKTAEQYYQPQYNSRLGALKDAIGERTASSRRGAIGRGTYTSRQYNNDIEREVSQPYVKEVSNLEGDMASMINQMAMQNFNTDKTAETTKNQSIANYLLGQGTNAQEQDWRRTLQAILMGGNLGQV
jgi:hypothetical protein